MFLDKHFFFQFCLEKWEQEMSIYCEWAQIWKYRDRDFGSGSRMTEQRADKEVTPSSASISSSVRWRRLTIARIPSSLTILLQELRRFLLSH